MTAAVCPLFCLPQEHNILNTQDGAAATREFIRPHYALFANGGADAGVSAARHFLQRTHYDDMWRAQLGAPKDAPVVSETRDFSLEQLLDYRYRHSASCLHCQRGMRALEAAGRALQAGAGACFLAALAAATPAGAAVLGEGLAVAAAPLGLGAAALALAASKVWLDGYYEERFISGVRKWRRKGGLSLIKM